ncbi:class I SAM-dependent methyltransferase [Thioalkalivibrio sp.]|uniref:class I SAM-dependent methyltransferase n=1 Tax=Thioalkalivibrio sp. TaxID=2093813 RepID=UPI00356AC1D2
MTEPVGFHVTPDCPPRSRRTAESLLEGGHITAGATGRSDLELICRADGLTLVAHPASGPALELHIDLVGGARGYRHARAERSREDLVRALGRLPRGSRIIDASAGLGRDALVLAARGFEVVAVERNPVLAALLRDAMERASSHRVLRASLDRLSLQQADVREWLSRHEGIFDAAVFDPMFPPRRKDAEVRKEMRIVHRLLGANPDPDAPETLKALQGRVRRCVVVKRPLHAPAVGGLRPARSLRGRSTRFDVYLPSTVGSQPPGRPGKG